MLKHSGSRTLLRRGEALAAFALLALLTSITASAAPGLSARYYTWSTRDNMFDQVLMERVEPIINEVSRPQNTLLRPGGPQARNFAVVWTGTIRSQVSRSCT